MVVIRCKDVYCDDEFEVDYDKLVIGVGARNNTFGIPGVEEHAHFLKELKDARAIRGHLLQQFEHSTMPTMKESDKKRYVVNQSNFFPKFMTMFGTNDK